MTRHRDFFCRSEVAGTDVSDMGFDNERGFGKIHLPCNGEHRCIIKRIGIKHNGAWIPLERTIRERVNLIQGE